jgi:hypothetical protein
MNRADVEQLSVELHAMVGQLASIEAAVDAAGAPTESGILKYSLAGRVRMGFIQLREQLAAVTKERDELLAAARVGPQFVGTQFDYANAYVIERNRYYYTISHTRPGPADSEIVHSTICLSFDSERSAECEADLQLLKTLGRVFTDGNVWCPATRPISALVERIAKRSRRYDRPRNTY